VITENDLDLVSAATPSVIAHTLYIAGGMHVDDNKYPYIIDGGFSYSFSHTNAIINKWMLWVKMGFSF
jgi:hypothetical protein